MTSQGQVVDFQKKRVEIRFRQLVDHLLDYAEDIEFGAQSAAGMRKYMGELFGDPDAGFSGDDVDGAENEFLEWLILDYDDDDIGVPIAREYIDTVEDDELYEWERRSIEQWADSAPAIYEVEEIQSDDKIILRDVVLGDTYEVIAPGVGVGIIRWSSVLARLMLIDDVYTVGSTAVVIPRPMLRYLLRIVGHVYRTLRSQGYEGGWNDFLKVSTLSIRRLVRIMLDAWDFKETELGIDAYDEGRGPADAAAETCAAPDADLAGVADDSPAMRHADGNADSCGAKPAAALHGHDVEVTDEAENGHLRLCGGTLVTSAGRLAAIGPQDEERGRESDLGLAQGWTPDRDPDEELQESEEPCRAPRLFRSFIPVRDDAKAHRAVMGIDGVRLLGDITEDDGGLRAEYAWLRPRTDFDPSGAAMYLSRDAALIVLEGSTLKVHADNRSTLGTCASLVRKAAAGVIMPRAKGQKRAALPRPTAEEIEQVAARIQGIVKLALIDHYNMWADTPLPVLLGYSPRDAVASGVGERIVEELIKDIEYHERLKRRLGMPWVDVDALWEQLLSGAMRAVAPMGAPRLGPKESSVARMLDAMMRQEGYTDDQIFATAKMWSDYVEAASPNVVHANTWAAAVEYASAVALHEPVTQVSVAEKYEVSVSTLSQRYRQILRSLDL